MKQVLDKLEETGRENRTLRAALIAIVSANDTPEGAIGTALAANGWNANGYEDQLLSHVLSEDYEEILNLRTGERTRVRSVRSFGTSSPDDAS